MFRQFFANASLFDLPVIAMGIFIAIFVTVILRACQRSRGAEYQRMADLPLQDDINGSKLP